MDMYSNDNQDAGSGRPDVSPDVEAGAQAIREDIKSARRQRRRDIAKGAAIGALACLALCFAALLAFSVYLRSSHRAEAASVRVLTDDVRSKIGYITNIVDQLYYEDIDDEELAQGLYKGLMEGVGDKYSVYYTPEEYESMMVDATSTLTGIGALLQQDPDTMQVSIAHVYEGSPAEKAGLMDGDAIVSVGDIDSASMELSELVAHIRGEKGTVVHLLAYRVGKGYMEFDVERDEVNVPTMDGEMLGDGVGYIAVYEFGDKTGEEFDGLVKELAASGMKALIIDLRDNPGGMVASAINVLDRLMPEGVMFWTEDKAGKKVEYTSDPSCLDCPFALLVNGNSASSSEIVAGAVKAGGYGTLIGTKTFGKGIVQTIRPLPDGSAVKLTTARFFTPDGICIHGEGIAPDIELEYKYMDPSDTEYDPLDDNQVRKAIEVLKKQI